MGVKGAARASIVTFFDSMKPLRGDYAPSWQVTCKPRSKKLLVSGTILQSRHWSPAFKVQGGAQANTGHLQLKARLGALHTVPSKAQAHGRNDRWQSWLQPAVRLQ